MTMNNLSTNNLFHSYTLSSQETLIGSILTNLQKQCIQNQISQIAHEKLKLKFTPNDVSSFLQQEAELQGKLNALEYLLELSHQAEVDTNSAPITIVDTPSSGE
jgi:hypothetical protein